jgi:hypothetical protein
METFKGQLRGQAIFNYVSAGRARFTIQNPETGTRFTYRVYKKIHDLYFVSVLAGSDNESDYMYIGFIRDGRFFHGGTKSRVSTSAPSVAAFGWFWRHIADPSPALVFHDGKCGCCGRSLTVPESVESGLGPECAKRTGTKRPGVRKAKDKDSIEAREEASGLEDLRRSFRGGFTGEPMPVESEEREMQRMEAEADREQTEREEEARERWKMSLEDHDYPIPLGGAR